MINDVTRARSYARDLKRQLKPLGVSHLAAHDLAARTIGLRDWRTLTGTTSISATRADVETRLRAELAAIPGADPDAIVDSLLPPATTHQPSVEVVVHDGRHDEDDPAGRNLHPALEPLHRQAALHMSTLAPQVLPALRRIHGVLGSGLVEMPSDAWSQPSYKRRQRCFGMDGQVRAVFHVGGKELRVDVVDGGVMEDIGLQFRNRTASLILEGRFERRDGATMLESVHTMLGAALEMPHHPDEISYHKDMGYGFAGGRFSGGDDTVVSAVVAALREGAKRALGEDATLYGHQHTGVGEDIFLPIVAGNAAQDSAWPSEEDNDRAAAIVGPRIDYLLMRDFTSSHETDVMKRGMPEEGRVTITAHAFDRTWAYPLDRQLDKVADEGLRTKIRDLAAAEWRVEPNKAAKELADVPESTPDLDPWYPPTPTTPTMEETARAFGLEYSVHYDLTAGYEDTDGTEARWRLSDTYHGTGWYGTGNGFRGDRHIKRRTMNKLVEAGLVTVDGDDRVAIPQLAAVYRSSVLTGYQERPLLVMPGVPVEGAVRHGFSYGYLDLRDGPVFIPIEDVTTEGRKAFIRERKWRAVDPILPAVSHGGLAWVDPKRTWKADHAGKKAGGHVWTRSDRRPIPQPFHNQYHASWKVKVDTGQMLSIVKLGERFAANPLPAEAFSPIPRITASVEKAATSDRIPSLPKLSTANMETNLPYEMRNGAKTTPAKGGIRMHSLISPDRRSEVWRQDAERLSALDGDALAKAKVELAKQGRHFGDDIPADVTQLHWQVLKGGKVVAVAGGMLVSVERGLDVDSARILATVPDSDLVIGWPVYRDVQKIDLQRGDLFVLEEVEVLPAHRETGVAKALLARVRDDLAGMSARGVGTYVSSCGLILTRTRAPMVDAAMALPMGRWLQRIGAVPDGAQLISI